MTTAPDLAAAIHALSLALDPQHQGEQWPDPIAWDGRTLAEQAHDLLSLARARIADGSPLNRGGAIEDAVDGALDAVDGAVEDAVDGVLDAVDGVLDAVAAVLEAMDGGAIG